MVTKQNTLSQICFFKKARIMKTQFMKHKSVIAAVTACLALSVSSVNAGPLEQAQAKRIYERLTGLQPSEATLTAMEAQLVAGNGVQAALDVMNGVYGTGAQEGFLGGTLKRMAAPWTNRDQDPFEPLNDYMATFIGLVNDGDDFRKILYDDILYTHPSVSPSYSATNNNHYLAIESQAAPLRQLTAQSQSTLEGIPSSATAGVITSRAGSRAFFYLGTNRAMLRFTLKNQLCHDLEQMEDITRTPDRIRQDVSRSPGGDSRLFLTSCVGCHSGMDPMVQAFAYYNYVDPDDDPGTDDGNIVYNSTAQPNPELGIDTQVQPKYHINATNFPYGYVTLNDNWDNYWRQGINEAFGWDYGNNSPGGSGSGAKSLGRELANSYAFAQCQVEKVFSAVCLRKPATLVDDSTSPPTVLDTADADQVAAMTTSFKNSGYNLKQVFAETADYCKGN